MDHEYKINIFFKWIKYNFAFILCMKIIQTFKLKPNEQRETESKEGYASPDNWLSGHIILTLHKNNTCSLSLI